MSNQPLVVPGVASPVSVSWNMWTGRHTVMVGAQAATATGKRTYALPTADGGTVEGSVSRSTLFNPFPTLEVDGVKHPTGPEVSVPLRVLMVAPIVLILFGGLLGAAVAVGAIVVNFSVARSTRHTGIKALLMALTLAAAVAVWAAVVAVLF